MDKDNTKAFATTHSYFLKKVRIYFIYETIIPFFDLATFIPRKYLKDPRSLISNVVEMELFKRFISNASSPTPKVSGSGEHISGEGSAAHGNNAGLVPDHHKKGDLTKLEQELDAKRA
ncbi:hypothetical protein CR513_15856, partial [Mucuna pruriens]